MSLQITIDQFCSLKEACSMKAVEDTNLLKLFYKQDKLNTNNALHAGKIFKNIREEQKFKIKIDKDIQELLMLM